MDLHSLVLCSIHVQSLDFELELISFDTFIISFLLLTLINNIHEVNQLLYLLYVYIHFGMPFMNLMTPLTSHKFCIFNISTNEHKVCFLPFFVSILLKSDLSFASQGHSQRYVHRLCSCPTITNCWQHYSVLPGFVWGWCDRFSICLSSLSLVCLFWWLQTMV
jgi:hypothetical protein